MMIGTEVMRRRLVGFGYGWDVVDRHCSGCGVPIPAAVEAGILVERVAGTRTERAWHLRCAPPLGAGESNAVHYPALLLECLHDNDKPRLIATGAHEGQQDKAGLPYIGHPWRMATALIESGFAADSPEVATAWLHDVVEDTNLGLGDLRWAGIPEVVVEAVDAMTRRPGEPEDLRPGGDPRSKSAYLNRVADNDVALVVKRADIADNLLDWRLQKLTQWTRQGLVRKYESCSRILDELSAGTR